MNDLIIITIGILIFIVLLKLSNSFQRKFRIDMKKTDTVIAEFLDELLLKKHMNSQRKQMSTQKTRGVVDFAFEQLANKGLLVYQGDYKNLRIYHDSKEMEKMLHSDTWEESRIEDKGDNYIGKQKSFDDYYTETYGDDKK